MSNIFRFAFPAVSHFQLPHHLDKWINSISLEELRLMLLVYSEAERTSLSDVRLSTDTICARTGMHRTNVSKTRRGLVDYGLLLVRKIGLGREYVYSIPHPTKGTVIPDKTSMMRIDYSSIGPDKMQAYFETFLTEPKPDSKGLKAHCPLPNHPDTNASFQVYLDKGGWSCRGCGKHGGLMDLEIHMSEDAVGACISRSEAHRRIDRKLRALGCGKSAKGKLVAPSDVVYSYTDEDSVEILQVVRRGGRKDRTVQRQPHPNKPGRWIYNANNCRNVLYRLHEVVEAGTVIVVEGEPDADRLMQLGLHDDTAYLVAVTTSRNGAGCWQPEHSETLRNKRVILCGDTNPAGIAHMEQVKQSLLSLGVELTQVNIPSAYRDVGHFLESHRPQEFIDLVEDEWLEDIENPDENIVSI